MRYIAKLVSGFASKSSRLVTEGRADNLFWTAFAKPTQA